MEKCANCGNDFVQKEKGWRRKRCNLLFEGKSGFFCDSCFYALKKSKSPVVNKRYSAPRTPRKSPLVKRFKPADIILGQRQPALLKSSWSPVVRNLTGLKYKAAVKHLMRKRGYRSASSKNWVQTIRQEIRDLLKRRGLKIRKALSLVSLATFSWDSIVAELQQHAPTTLQFLAAMLTTRPQEHLATEWVSIIVI